MLVAIKLVHTVVWGFFATCILTLPVAVYARRFRVAKALSFTVLVECAIFLGNGLRCPLTNLASRYTLDRSPNFDIYLPAVFARFNSVIFGLIFLLGELYFLVAWRSVRRKLRSSEALAQER